MNNNYTTPSPLPPSLGAKIPCIQSGSQHCRTVATMTSNSSPGEDLLVWIDLEVCMPLPLASPPRTSTNMR